MKLVSQEEQDAHQQATIAGGVKGFIAGMGVGLPGAYMLNRRWPYYRQLPISLKALSVIMVVVPSFVISAEHAGQRYEREQWTGMGKEELDLEALRAQQHWKSMSASEKAQDWFARHEYGVIGTAWAMSMAGAFGYIMRDPHQSMTMKVVQARMWAQGITIGIIIAAGAMSHARRVRGGQEGLQVKSADHSWLDIIEREEKDRAAAEAALQGRPGRMPQTP